MTNFRNNLEIVAKYSIISIFFVLALNTHAMADEPQKFNFGFDRIEGVISKNTPNWNTNFNNTIELTEKKSEPRKQDAGALSSIKRFAAMSASLLVEFTSNESFNKIEIN
jgi:hypothetical protein